MNIKDIMLTLVGKPIEFTVLDCTLFPYGIKDDEGKFQKLTLKPFSRDINGRVSNYHVMLGKFCVYVFMLDNAHEFSVTYRDGEIFEIKWHEFRIVNFENI